MVYEALPGVGDFYFLFYVTVVKTQLENTPLTKLLYLLLSSYSY